MIRQLCIASAVGAGIAAGGVSIYMNLPPMVSAIICFASIVGGTFTGYLIAANVLGFEEAVA